MRMRTVLRYALAATVAFAATVTLAAIISTTAWLTMNDGTFR